MAFTASKFTEMPLRTSLPLTSHSHSHSHSHSQYCFSNFLFFSQPPKPSFRMLKPFSSLRTKEQHNDDNRHHTNGRSSHAWNQQSPKPSAPWLDKWQPSSKVTEKVAESSGKSGIRKAQVESESQSKIRYLEKDKGESAIERIVLRLRNLGLGSDDEEDDDDGDIMEDQSSIPASGEERLGDLLSREWVRPDTILADRRNDEDDMVLPWERNNEEEERTVVEAGVLKKRRVVAPTLADLTIEDTELRRLRRNGMYLRERVSIPKAGLTQAVMEKIHDTWRKDELVRLKFHEVLARDMKTAHEIVERRTRGLVIWRSGSVMVVYRGNNYEGPSSSSKAPVREDLFVPDVSSVGNAAAKSDNVTDLTPEKIEPPVKVPGRAENITEEEAEINSLLDSLGPRFHEWWGTGILPVDADLLPPKIPDYKTPFRLLPAGMRPRVTNAEMTNLRKVAKGLPCHFALGRNRNHQGLAAAILKLWEKSLVAKIAVKRGIQNTNNKLMADEIKNLTGGVLLLRNKYYIVIFRGKDFLPASVAAALTERDEFTKEIQNVEEIMRGQGKETQNVEEIVRGQGKEIQNVEEDLRNQDNEIQNVEEKLRTQAVEPAQSGVDKGEAYAGTLAEFYEAQARWGREISPEEREKMIKEASRIAHARIVRRIEHKLALAQAKKLRAEKLLGKIELSMIPSGPDYDQETITDEERVVFRRIGLKMKAYLPLGIRGIFDGVIENMHLHWKHRELVKLISKQKTLAFVEDAARLLEYESGGILVAIERVPKGFALIYYRGKNYRRPVSLRPRNLLTKAKALKRSIAMQRHEAFSQHISELENSIEQMKTELTTPKDTMDKVDWSSEGQGQSASDWPESEEDEETDDDDEDEDEDSDIDWEEDEPDHDNQ